MFFRPVFPLHVLEKHEKTAGFLMFSEGVWKKDFISLEWAKVNYKNISFLLNKITHLLLKSFPFKSNFSIYIYRLVLWTFCMWYSYCFFKKEHAKIRTNRISVTGCKFQCSVHHLKYSFKKDGDCWWFTQNHSETSRRRFLLFWYSNLHIQVEDDRTPENEVFRNDS